MQELICSCADVIPESVNEENDEGDKCFVTFDDNSSSDSVNNVHQNNNNNNRTGYEFRRTLGEKRRYELPNPSAVLKTVIALIAKDCNPHHKNINNLKDQQEFQIKLKELKRNTKVSQHHEQLKEERRYMLLEHNGILLEEEDDRKDNDENYKQENNETQELIREEQNKLTATFTKEQMMMEFKNQNYDKFDHYDNNSNSGVGDGISCHYDYYANGQTDNGYSKSGHNYDSSYKNDKQNLYDSSTAALNVGNLNRHCNMKTFQKIKLNLITHHGNSSGNHCSSSTSIDSSTLQTIEETDNDVTLNNSSSTINSGVYQVIDEKYKIKENELALKVPCDQSSNDFASIKSVIASNMKYKLLNLSSLEKSCDKSLAMLSSSSECLEASATLSTSAKLLPSAVNNTVSKRIEFFEHANIPNGGIIKPKSNIYSIYRVNDNMIIEDDKLVTNVVKSKANGPSKSTSANPFLLRHDSHTLTIILSCVFIVTFLLLVFFPLPG